MAALPYMPLYVADYMADAAHLTALQHGAYLLMLMNYWQRGKPLPNDDLQLSRIARMGRREWNANKDVLRAFFYEEENMLVHGRVQSELAKVQAKSLKCKKAGLASVQRKLNERSTDVQQTLNHTDTDTYSSVDKSTGGEPPDPLQELFNLGVSILVGSGQTEKQARSLIGKWRKETKSDAKVLDGLLACRAQSISNPVEWLTKRFNGSSYVSASGYEYRGDDGAVMRQAEKRADWNTYWAIKGRAARSANPARQSLNRSSPSLNHSVKTLR